MNAERLRSAGKQTINLDILSSVGFGLVRPECVLATIAGDVYTADWRGGVCHLRPDATQQLYLGVAPDGIELKPNGIALLRDGSFLVTHLGTSPFTLPRPHCPSSLHSRLPAKTS